MALFSRRPKPAAASEETPTPEVTAAAEVNEAVREAQPTEDQPAVGISVSSFRGMGAQSTPVPVAASQESAATATAARPAESVPGLRDNVLLRDSLARLSEKPEPAELLDLARQVLQGHLFLRIKGDARALLADGKSLPLAVATIGDRKFALAYSSGAALTASIRADGDVETSAMGQPSMVVLRHVLDGDLTGLIIDPASAPARAILPRALIERMVSSMDEALTIKSLLAGEVTDDTRAAVAEALTRVPLWVAVNRAEDGTTRGIAEGRTADGARFLEVYTHPLEVVSMGRGDQPAPLTGAQLGKALRSDPALSGVIVDSRGPWMRLSREELAPVIAHES